MESKFVQAGQVRLEYFEQGHGLDTLVLVHGYSSSAAIWRYTLEYLAEDRFRVIVLKMLVVKRTLSKRKKPKMILCS